MKYIGDLGLSDDCTTVHCCDVRVKHVVIPSTVTTIGYRAFARCASLESVTIPTSVTHIYPAAFFACTNLKSIVIPESVVYVGSAIFSECWALESVSIPSSLHFLSHKMFIRCKSLVTITLPRSVIDIGPEAFAFCSNLTNIKYAGAFRYIGGGAFRRTNLQTKPISDGSNCYKAMSPDLKCRDYQYTLGKTFTAKRAICCFEGFHACLKIKDVFTYYSGEYGKDFVITECTASGQLSVNSLDSKFACTELTVNKVLTKEEVTKIITNECLL